VAGLAHRYPPDLRDAAGRMGFARSIARASVRRPRHRRHRRGQLASPLLDELANEVARRCGSCWATNDFYGSSIEAVRDRARSLTVEPRWLRWLPACGLVDVAEPSPFRSPRERPAAPSAAETTTARSEERAVAFFYLVTPEGLEPSFSA
jgi:hypothetical protein